MKKMKKVLYIANFLYREDSGATSVARTHLDVLINGYGEECVHTIALIGTYKKVEPLKNVNFEICSVDSNILKRGLNLVQGHTGKINRKIISRISRIIQEKQISIVFFDDSIYGLAIKKLKNKYKDVIFAAYYHDVKRNLCIEWIKKDPKNTLKYIPLMWNECLTAQYADYNIVLNKREEKEFVKYYKKDPELLLPVVLSSHENTIINVKLDNPIRILFIGGYYYPNVNGIDWFVKKVMSKLGTDFCLTIAGNGMERLTDKYSNLDNVNVYGRIEDLSEIYEKSDIIVGPIFEGAGMKVKTAEALSYGKCFIGTDESLEGYFEKLDATVKDKFIFRCNSDKEFIKTLEEIKMGTITVSKCNKEVLDFFEANYSITSAAKFLKSSLK